MRRHDLTGDGSAFLLVFDDGDEIHAELNAFLRDANIAQASFTAIGALSSVELLAFDTEAKKYRTAIKRDDQCELANLTGNATRKDGEPLVHAHLTIGAPDGRAFAGHLKRAFVRPTCEMVLHAFPVAARKETDDRWDLDLYRL